MQLGIASACSEVAGYQLLRITISVAALAAVWAFSTRSSAAAETFRVATYNLESYLDIPTETRGAKPPEAKTTVRDTILTLKPDILALQEMGRTNALLELQAGLKGAGLDLPYWEHVSGFDTNIHLAILSKFPFAARKPHTRDVFLLSGRRFRVSRGFGEVDIQITPGYTLTLLVAHLKSRRAVPQADETELRVEEAKVLREKIDARLAANPEANLVVVGDFNDTKDSESIKTVMGKGKLKLVDTRPPEHNGDAPVAVESVARERAITWTHFYGADDTYSRVDFILLSRGLAREWVTNQTYVLNLPDWGLASDHRPVVATFRAEDL